MLQQELIHTRLPSNVQHGFTSMILCRDIYAILEEYRHHLFVTTRYCIKERIFLTDNRFRDFGAVLEK